MTDQTKRPEQSGDQASRAKGASSGGSGNGDGYGNGNGDGNGYGDGYRDGRPKRDQILTQRFLALDDALNGPSVVARVQKLNWSGINEVTVAFDSIKEALEASFPVDRPTSDLPH